ncbi:hypothetical protein CEXT_667181 [Caerostris extrusa]|uniref:Uncharacterized protein n=1 Tax=Caerostris extrusa TaxID=172846 RepID=A0AAV4VSJ6_CAEEX|nr:hypothetical protein CEXT_667181 [Caerostris extrusa]
MFLLLPAFLKNYHYLPSANDLLEQSPFFFGEDTNLNEKAAPLGYDKVISPERSEEKHFFWKAQKNPILAIVLGFKLISTSATTLSGPIFFLFISFLYCSSIFSFFFPPLYSLNLLRLGK